MKCPQQHPPPPLSKKYGSTPLSKKE
ncbi:hypothetical protein AVEN_53020-1, partial [Araneus ventricosus]